MSDILGQVDEQQEELEQMADRLYDEERVSEERVSENPEAIDPKADIDVIIGKIGEVLGGTTLTTEIVLAIVDLLRNAYDTGYVIGHRRGLNIGAGHDKPSGGQTSGRASKASPEVEAAAVELADLVIQMEGAPSRALALAATISGLMSTPSGVPSESTSVVQLKDLQEGSIYLGHVGTGTFTWKYVGRMPDGERIRVIRDGGKITVERLADHGLVGGGPRGNWTEFTGITREGIAHVADAASDVELPEGDPDVLGN